MYMTFPARMYFSEGVSKEWEGEREGGRRVGPYWLCSMAVGC